MVRGWNYRIMSLVNSPICVGMLPPTARTELVWFLSKQERRTCTRVHRDRACTCVALRSICDSHCGGVSYRLSSSEKSPISEVRVHVAISCSGWITIRLPLLSHWRNQSTLGTKALGWQINGNVVKPIVLNLSEKYKERITTRAWLCCSVIPRAKSKNTKSILF